MLSVRYKTILKVAIPLMAGTFIQSIVSITDAAILSRYSTLSFDASGNAGLLYITLFMGLTGLGDAAQIVMARRIGETKNSFINGLLQSSFLINLIFGIAFFALIFFGAKTLLYSYSSNLALADEQILYLRTRAFGFFTAAFIVALNGYFMALGKTWVILVSTAIFAFFNIFLDILLIFGYGIFPEMGIRGAAIATVISEFVSLLVLVFFLFKSKEFKQFEIFTKIAITKQSVINIIKVGFPLVIQGFFALGTWTLFFTWIEQIGTYELTVSQNIRSIYFLAFVPIFGFGATTKTYIAQYISRHPNFSKIIIRRIQLLILLFLFLFFHGAILYPKALVTLINPKEIYLEDSAQILRLIFGSILLYGFTTPYFQTINGSGNTRVSLSIEIISIFIYMSSAYVFIKVWELNITQVWLVEYIYFGTLGLLSFSYLKLFNWRKKIF